MGWKNCWWSGTGWYPVPGRPCPARVCRAAERGSDVTDAEAILAEYRRKGLASSVGFGRRAALLVVDMIEGFTDPSSPLGADLTAVVDHIGRLLAVCRSQHIPVYFTTVAYEAPDCQDGGWFVRKVPSLKMLRAGSRWVQVDARLRNLPEEEVLVKKYASAFFGTGLQERLSRRGVDTLIVTGCTTSGCVRATVVDGMQHGYRVIVPLEAVGDRNAEAHAANLVDIQGKYGDVVPMAEVEKRLGGGPSTDRS